MSQELEDRVTEHDRMIYRLEHGLDQTKLILAEASRISVDAFRISAENAVAIKTLVGEMTLRSMEERPKTQ